MARRGRSGDPAKHQWWRELVRRWRESGETVREFCRRTGMKESAFYWWRQRLACGGRRPGKERGAAGRVAPRKGAEVTSRPGAHGRRVAAQFLPLTVVLNEGDVANSRVVELSSPAADVRSAVGGLSSGVEIHWGNGRSVRLQRRFDRQTLVEVLSVLEAWPC